MGLIHSDQKHRGVLAGIDKRIRELRQKSHLFCIWETSEFAGEFRDFLQSIVGKNDITYAAPIDVRRFLIWKER